jgi:predicted nucleotidyltransferase component of viral defense system
LEVDWWNVENQLNTVGKTQPALIDKTQCDFIVEDVRITFLADNKFKQPENLQKIPLFNNLKIVDTESIGVMKMEVMTRRTVYRDFYDLYAILESGIALEKILYKTGKYTFHNIRTRDMLSVLANASEPKADSDFLLKLHPIYNLSFAELKEKLLDYAKNIVK